MEELVVDHKVDSVTFYINGAVVTRSAVIGAGGARRIVLEDVEGGVDPDSLRVYLSKGHARSAVYEAYKRWRPGPPGEAERLEKLRREKRALELRVKGLAKYLDSIDGAFESAVTALLATASAGRADADSVLEALTRIREERERAAGELVEAEARLREVERLLEEAESRLKGGGLVDSGRIVIEADGLEEGSKLAVAYTVKKAYWRPSYDISVDDGAVRVALYAELVQQTGAAWRGVRPYITSRALGRAVKREPRPWRIRIWKPRPRPLPQKPKAAPLGAVAKMEAPPRPSFREAQRVPGAYISYTPPYAVDIEPGRPLLLLLREDEYEGEVRVFWDAFTGDPPVEYARFVNTGDPLPPGQARIYRGGTFIGKTQLPRVATGQEVELALTHADPLEAEKRQVSGAASKKLLGGHAVLTRRYEIRIKSHYRDDVEVEVYDRVPVSEDPEVKAKLVDAEPPPTIDKGMGIIGWRIKLRPGEERRIRFGIQVSYPADKQLEGI